LVLRANDLESIGDIIDKNIVSLARKTMKKGYVFSKEGWKDIVLLHEKVLECLRLSTAYFTSRDRSLHSKVNFLYEQIDEMNFEFNERHIKRLHHGVKESLETSAVHMDVLSSLQRIASLSLNFLRTEDRNFLS
jgi:phosphate:Na+ symporter